MNIQSSFEKDIRRVKTTPGAYEWWYFEAESDDGEISLVIIFYEGNPFSRRYMNRVRAGEDAMAEDFPAVSISIYEKDQPIYYSFTEAKKEHVVFKKDRPHVQVENHCMEAEKQTESWVYRLILDETLPSGDAIEADLRFISGARAGNRKALPAFDIAGHRWHVDQLKAQVEGVITCHLKNRENRQIEFAGVGYHDHNIGPELLSRQFSRWYWGSFHFPESTLIYYLAEGHDAAGGWLIPQTPSGKIRRLRDVHKEDYARNIFGLKSARKIALRGEDAEVMVQQRQVVDNGPFYQRFSSDAFLTDSRTGKLAKSRGLTEYLCPPRIHHRLFRPLTNMRIRYKQEPPHWVQRSPRLYRWTW